MVVGVFVAVVNCVVVVDVDVNDLVLLRVKVSFANNPLASNVIVLPDIEYSQLMV